MKRSSLDHSTHCPFKHAQSFLHFKVSNIQILVCVTDNFTLLMKIDSKYPFAVLIPTSHYVFTYSVGSLLLTAPVCNIEYSFSPVIKTGASYVTSVFLDFLKE